jgi:hypothetical protein
MNPYLSRDEKEHFIRLTCLRLIIEQAIETYNGLKSTDKTFLSELRHARTRLDKALTIRSDALDKSAKEDLIKSVAKLQLMFLPTPEAKKAHKEMLELKSVLPVELEDFNDWYEFVIESSCKVCSRPDYEECPARRVLSKYGVYPIDPEAVGKCQYSYAEGVVGPVPQPDPATAGDQSEKANDLLKETTAIEIDVTPELAASLEAAAKDPGPASTLIEGWKPIITELLPVTFGLMNGSKLELDLPKHMAIVLLEELRRPGRLSRGLCARHVDNELIAVDMQEVVVMLVSGLEDGEWVNEQIKPATENPFQEDGERERYRVECKCGVEYFCSMNPGRTKARCRDCKATVFADRQVDPVTDPLDGVAAVLMTNRYWVEKTVGA